MILASTTTNWNPGDEFILEGCKNLLSIHDNIAIYNRNPDLFNKKRIRSNSWLNQDLSIFKYILIAGSPEWCGKPLEPLFQAVKYYKTPTLFLGIGCWGANAPTKLDKEVISKAKIITCRDEETKKILEKNGITNTIHVLPCPALFYSTNFNFNFKNKIEKIGIIAQSTTADESHNIDNPTFRKTINLIKKLKSKYQVSLIHHYFKELYHPELRNLQLPTFYSYNSSDYGKIYEN